MANDEQAYFHELAQGIADLQSRASQIGLERQHKHACIYEEECDKSKDDQLDENQSLKVIIQTTEITRLAMSLIDRCVQFGASYSSRKSKYFTSLSSAIAFLRNREDQGKLSKHLLVEWEKNLNLIDLLTTNKSLYCSERLAQDMFDICLNTFDWLRSICDHKD